MSTNRLLEALERALQSWMTADGRLNRAKIQEAARKFDPGLLAALRTEEEVRKVCFREVEGVCFFDVWQLEILLDEKRFLPENDTSYGQRIGLSYGRQSAKYLMNQGDVVLNFPYKDCLLEGGQTREEKRRRERFWNEMLAPEEVNRLLAPKVLTGFARYTSEGEAEVSHTIDPLKENWLIKGNNLLALHTLKTTFAGKVKLIYIDPPYNTGGEANAFAYNNNFNHSSWLVFMKDRLQIAKSLLREDGFIAIAIDHYELFYLGVLVDEIFGRENRIGIVSVVNNPMGRNQAKYFSTINDYMIVYAKNKANASFNDVILSEGVAKTFDKEDKQGKYKLTNFIRMGGGEVNLRKNKESFWYPLYVNSNLTTVSIEKIQNYFEVYPITNKGQERTWKLSKNSTKERLSELVPIEENGKVIIYEKYRINKGQKVPTVWADKKYNSNHHGVRLLDKIMRGKSFSFPKSIYTIIDTLQIMTKDNDIILDFFSGSGTTGHAVLELNKQDQGNRKFILVEQMDYIESVTRERLKKVMEGEQGGVSKELKWQGGGSFIYCELKKHNQTWIEQIEAAQDSTALQKIWEQMQKKADLDYRLTTEDRVKIEAALTQQDTETMKEVLKEQLDANMLYVPYSEIDDQTYSVSEQEKVVNRIIHSR